ncbi:MAG TPA: N-acetylmuramoyl-L-alanine amidase [Gemmatimonadaceae bacterium]|jgi:N-acetylmuramoyl-L-alanine amidase
MIAGFAAFQLAAATALVVKTPNDVVRIAATSTSNGPMISADALKRVMPIHVTRDSSSWYTIEVWGGKVQLQSGSTTIRVGDEIRPLVAAPAMRNGTLMLPLQVVSEVFPALLPNIRWDADNARLVLFTSIATTKPATPNPSTVGSVTTTSDGDVKAPGFVPARGGALPKVAVKDVRHLIVVDAGHGGIDNGMSGPIGGGPKIYEKDITLAVAKRLGAQLKERGVDVVYTRTSDTLIALDDRGRIANKTHGDLFISVHVNAANPNWKDPGGSRGFETYFLSAARTEDAKRVEHIENDAAGFETEQPVEKTDPRSFILSDMLQNEYLRESSELAEGIQGKLGEMHPGTNRGVKQAGFRVLVTSFMPSVLVEIGFGTNPKEAKYLSDASSQDALAKAIADGAMAYLGKHDDRVRGYRAGDSPRSGGAPK